MSKTKHIIIEEVMKKILTGQVTMKPRWYFVVGSVAMVLGLIGSIIASIFLVSIIVFSLRTHGPMGSVRLEQLISSFPLWAPILAFFGLACGIWLLKQYEFSYKKNFPMIILSFVLAVLCAGWLMDYSGMTTVWSRTGYMRRLYQRSEKQHMGIPRSSWWRNMQQYR